MTDKIELINQVLAGKTVNKPPISLWYHFGVQHGSGRQLAETTLDYLNYYDFDFLKVMNDYFYPSPEGVEAVTSASDLKKLLRFDVRESTWQEQFKALEIIANRLKGKVYFIDTVFDAWQSLNRNLAAENLKQLIIEAPDDLLEALDRIADNLIAYSKTAIEIGAAGIFLSIPAGAEIVSRQEFLTFVKPFARKVLETISPLGKLTTLHVHGKELFFDDVLDLPAPVFNWWDRGPKGPNLQWVHERIPGCVMGGIDQTIVARRTRPFLRNHIREALELGGDRRFFLANGCTIDSWVYPGAIEAIVETARN
jgi:uroporphyrinogen decarboxylase